jgi:hypothetical protein
MTLEVGGDRVLKQAGPAAEVGDDLALGDGSPGAIGV